MKKYVLACTLVFVLGIGIYYAIKAPDPIQEETGPIKEALTMDNSLSNIKINSAESVISWSAQKIIGSGHEGTVQIKEVVVDWDGDKIKSAALFIDMNSIKDSDNTEMLINHLKSDDFFAVATYPESKFELKSLDADGIVGTLTIKGISNEVKVPGSIETVDGKLVLESEFSIDRTLWNIRYGSGKFFENLGDKTIKDEITFKVKLVAEKA